MNKVFYCIPTYKAFDLAAEGIHAVMRGSLKPTSIVVIDNSGNGSGALYLNGLTAIYQNLYIWPQTTNIGVAASWNLFHQTINDDYIIIANDDVAVHEDTIERMVLAADLYTDDVLFSLAGMAGNVYSLFLLKNKGYKHIGKFDERFYPAYFEDNDYEERRLRLGYAFQLVNAGCDHHGSSTLKRYTPDEMMQHHHNFRRNAEYFNSKWGGMPGNTRYSEPFDGLL